MEVDEVPDVVACVSCRAPMFFARSTSTGNLMPFDAVAVPDGTFRLDRDLFGEWSATFIPAGGRPARLFRSHFATCPEAPYWRRNEGQS